MSRDDEPLAHIARAILDGESIDWLGAESRASGNDRALIDELRLICSVADIHRQLSSIVDPDPPLDGGPHYWGRLRLIERVGGGTSGEVYRAWDARLQREVALKLIDVDDGPDGRLSSSILREARLLARVRHPGVVTLYDAEQIEARVGLWMELIDGPTLQQRVEQGGAFSADEAIDIGGHLCDALSAVHQAGVLHREV